MSMNKFFDITDNFEDIIKEILGTNLVSVTRISNGWTNFVFLATDFNNNSFYFRFPRNDFFSDALVCEVEYTNFVKNKISFKTTNLQLKYHRNRPFSVHKLIVGKNLYDVLDSIPNDKKQNLCDDICKFIKELQNIDYTELKQIPRLSLFLHNLAIISQINENYDFSKHNELIKKENNYSLVLNHGDLNPGNILINSNFEIEAVLDFAFCSISSYDNDLARIIGRMPNEYKDLLINSFEKIFDTKLNIDSLNNLISMWNYIDNNYINYMKVNCPDVNLDNILNQ